MQTGHPESGELGTVEDFEKGDYTSVWRRKRLEDEAQKRIIRGWLAHSGSCLELGGGFGRITGIIEEFFDLVVMVELAWRNLSVARTNLRKANLIRADIAQIPAVESSFDYVVMVRVVHLLSDPMKVMQEIRRVSRDGGTLIMSVPNMPMNQIARLIDGVASAELGHSQATFGRATWPIGEEPYLEPYRTFVPKSFELKERRGTGLFDNFFGMALNRYKFLHLVDVATSPLWFLKLDVFLKFEIHK
jgi:SAM-dependent methyltransferase